MRDMFVNNPQLIQETALRNSLVRGPMSGFDIAKLDEEFFAAGKCESCEQGFFPKGHVRVFFATSAMAILRRSCRGALGSTICAFARELQYARKRDP
jgi:hypothetical protein